MSYDERFEAGNGYFLTEDPFLVSSFFFPGETGGGVREAD
jgi:hypothetical protein